MIDNLTIVIPFFNGHDTVDHLLSSLPADIPILIIDDISDLPYRVQWDGTRIIRLDEKGYFAGAVNRGIQECETDILVLNYLYFFRSKWRLVITYESETLRTQRFTKR